MADAQRRERLAVPRDSDRSAGVMQSPHTQISLWATWAENRYN